jgi:hypothetical protein
MSALPATAQAFLESFGTRLRNTVLPSADAMRAGLALGRGEAPLHLDWIVAAMAFLAALAILGAVATSDAAQHWRQALTGTVTVEIPAAAAGTAAGVPDDRLARVLSVLRNEPGVARAVPLPQRRMIELLSPWLGSSGLVDTLPLPQLIDVTLYEEVTSTCRACSAGSPPPRPGRASTIIKSGSPACCAWRASASAWRWPSWRWWR